MKKTFLPALLALCSISVFAAGCSSEAGAAGADEGGDPTVDATEGADKIADFEFPETLLGRVSRKLSDNIVADDVGKTFGTPDEVVPYPDTYWPMTENGIDAEWNSGEKSPLEKYALLDDPAKLDSLREWNRKNAGKDVPGVQGWFGICHGWTGAAVTEKPVKKTVFAKRAGGRVEACAEGSEGCLRFDIGDVNALLATIYADGGSKFVGGRCDTAPADIKRDADGRVSRYPANGSGCKGINPGALLVILGHRMKRDQKPMAIDAQTPHNTNEIWNQPAYRYTVNRFEVVSEKEAANLVVKGTKEGSERKYRWNKDAKGFAFLDVSVHWVSENGPNVSYVSGLESTRKTRMTAVIELDKPGSDAGANIIGGELTKDATAGTDRLQNHPFVWLSTGPRPDGARRQNPGIKSSLVKQLAALGQ